MKTLLFVLCLGLFSCGNSSDYENKESYLADMAAPVMEEAVEMRSSGEPQVERKVVKTGNLSLRTSNVEDTYEEVKGLVSKAGGYIEHENQDNYAQRKGVSMTIRVPADEFDNLMKALVRIGDMVESKSVSINDVTERYYDLETRIKNKEALEKRYLELLGQANKIPEILQIEQNLNEVRTQIEIAQGQFNYLQKQIGYSTLNLSFYKELPYQYDQDAQLSFLDRIAAALSKGWFLFVSFIVWLVKLWPFIIVLIFLVILWRRFKNKRRM